MTTHEELNKYVGEIEAVVNRCCPSFLTPNSSFVSVVPGHNLDLLQITFDLRIDRTSMFLSETPIELQDVSKPELKVLK